ncbi:cyclase/dehydrase [Actinoplanes sp. NPDC051494]|uniref:cyclase/dehydrase n=1 Tax=Actinoplanes sp. NPDC051494 TaxID=3363907 RepID=UPI0037A811A1
MPVVIEVVTEIAADRAVVFDLELDMDVHAASLAGSAETARTSTGRRRLSAGDEVTFRARHFGIRWRMTSRITMYDRPHRFVDEQVRGPFRMMRHEHTFEQVGAARTRMTDRMSVAAPFGMLGSVVTRWMVAPYLRRLLVRRAEHIAEMARLAGGDPV